MWERRSFASAMPLEEIRTSHQDTLLGNVWHLVNPMLSVAVYYLVFAVFLNANRGIDNYVLWMMIGVFTFGLTNRSEARRCHCDHQQCRTDAFDADSRALLPVSAVFGRLLTFGSNWRCWSSSPC